MMYMNFQKKEKINIKIKKLYQKEKNANLLRRKKKGSRKRLFLFI